MRNYKLASMVGRLCQCLVVLQVILPFLAWPAASFAPKSSAVLSRHVPVPLRSLLLAHVVDDGLHREGNNEEESDKILSAGVGDRRDFLGHLVTGSLTASVVGSLVAHPSAAHAVGLVQFPCTKPLHNQYYFMRAGTTLLEEEDIWSTNPLFLTNREGALSDKGKLEVQESCRILEAAKVNPSVIKYSLAASAMDTTAVVRDELKVGQNRIVPEFTFMDPRAIGKWDMMSIKQALPAVVAMDAAEAGKEGLGARPPANSDGTPHETLADQAIRLRQLMSIMETQYSGDSILLVFPDGTSPALLSCMMAGIPYNECHELEYAPGEVRLDVTMQSVLATLEAKRAARRQQKQQPPPSVAATEVAVFRVSDNYENILAMGQKELKKMRSMDMESFVSKKDQMIENEYVAAEKQYRQKEAARLAQEEEVRQARLQRVREVEDERLRQRGIDPSSVAVTTSGEKGSNEEVAAFLVGGGALAAFGVLVGKASDDPKKGVPDAPLDPNNRDGQNTTALASNLMDLKEASLEDTINDYASPNGREQASSSLFDKPVPVVSKEERIEAANQAMFEYLDEDDGGDAWLQAMEQIIEEDSEELMLFVSDDDDDDDQDSFPTISKKLNTKTINGSNDLVEQQNSEPQ